MQYTNYDLKDTIVALATPAGVGAIGVIRLSGTKAIELANSVFKGKDLVQQKSHTIHFGKILNEEKIILDEVCLLYTSPSPRDATLSRMPSSA